MFMIPVLLISVGFVNIIMILMNYEFHYKTDKVLYSKISRICNMVSWGLIVTSILLMLLTPALI